MAIKPFPKLNLEPYFQRPIALKDFGKACKRSQGGDIPNVIFGMSEEPAATP